MNSTSPDQAINPDQPAPPVRRVVRLDADYLGSGPGGGTGSAAGTGTGARPGPAPDANEPEEEQLIVLPRRSGSWLVRFVRWLFS